MIKDSVSKIHEYYVIASTLFFHKAPFRRFPSFVFYAFSSAIILTGCASTEDLGRMQWDINELKSEMRGMKEKAPTQQSQREKQDKRLQDIQAEQESTAKAVADLVVQIQSLTTEFRILTGRFEESRYYAEKNSAVLKAEREKLDLRIKELELAIDDLKKKASQMEASSKAEASQPVEGTKQPDQGNKAVEKETAEKTGADEATAAKAAETEKKEPAAEEEETKAEVKDVYMAAYQAYKDGKTVEAREKFQTILKDYPNNEYTDNARFWLAESYYKDSNYEDAILAYEEILKKNPKSDKIPGALLKQGLSFYALKDEKTGRIILEKLIEAYPNSEQAKIAAKKIGKPAPSKKK
ncbi:MAG: tol-pal system protein YbgF [Nitrospiraceae bacterium]|nr:MAG: tol-pal system protein YbgF [Nitrospiraceae bacterium]